MPGPEGLARDGSELAIPVHLGAHALKLAGDVERFDPAAEVAELARLQTVGKTFGLVHRAVLP